MTLVVPARARGLFVPAGMDKPPGITIPVINVLSRRAGGTAGTSATVTMSGQGANFGTLIILASCAKTAGTMTSPSVGTITDTSGASPAYIKQATGVQLSDGTSSVYSEVWSGRALWPSTSFSVTVPFNGSPDIVFVELLAVLNCNPWAPLDRNWNGPFGTMFLGGTTNTTPKNHTIYTDAPNVMPIGHAFGNQGGNFAFSTSQLTGGTDNRNSGNFCQTGGVANSPTLGAISGLTYTWSAQGTEVWQEYYGFLVPDNGGNDSHTTLLLHMDGPNGGTTFTDVSYGEWGTTSASPTGSVSTSTSQSVFGGASMSLPSGTGDLAVTPQSTFNFGTSDFTIDFWYYSTANQTGQYLVCKNTGAGGFGPFSFFNSAGNIAWYVGSTGTSWDIASPVGGAQPALTINTWHHIALVRNGTTFTFYLDGVSQGSSTSSASLFSNSTPLHIGGAGGNNGPSAQCYVDEFRVSNNARWTANFTPPTSLYY